MGGKIKIFHSYPRWMLSGVNSWSVNLCRGMDPDRFENRMLFTGVPRQPQPEFDALGLPCDFLDVPGTRTRPAEWRELKRFLESQAPCIYIPNYDFHRSCAAGTFPPSVKICAVIHSDEPCWYDEVRRLGSSFDRIVAVSAKISGQLQEEFPTLASRVSHIPHGIALNKPCSATARNSETLQLAYCNRLSQYQKRIFDLPEIAAELKRRNVAFHLTVVGDGPDAEALRTRFRAAGLVDEISLTGRLSNPEVIQLLERADACLLTSDFEGLPISLLEAMGAGAVPVVYQIASGVGEAVQAEVNGLVVPHGDTRAFATALERLANDRPWLERLRRAAANTIRERFTLTQMCESYARLFTELSSQPAAQPVAVRDSRVRRPKDLTFSHRLMRRLRRLAPGPQAPAAGK